MFYYNHRVMMTMRSLMFLYLAASTMWRSQTSILQQLSFRVFRRNYLNEMFDSIFHKC